MSKNRKFNISLSPHKTIYLDEPGWCGRISCNELEESFFSPSGCWSRLDYLVHWKTQLENLLAGQSFAKLIISWRDFKDSNFIPTWIVFKVEQEFVLRNKYFFLDHERTPTFEDFMKEKEVREIFNDDGLLISEWKLSKEAIENFIRTLGI